MTSAFTGMEFNGYVSSPSASPNNTVFSSGPYFDSNSDTSSPSSPHMSQMMFSPSMSYDMYQYGATPSSFLPAHGSTRIAVDLASNTSEEKDRRRKRSDASKGGEKEAIPNMHLRRRAQNRASQRAFRERKEKHVKGLEHQLEELHEKHQDLLQSYTKQIDEVSRLNARIGELSSQLNTIRHCQDTSFGELMISDKFDKFDKFDAFSSTDMIYHATADTYYDKGPLDHHHEFALNSFEDSL